MGSSRFFFFRSLRIAAELARSGVWLTQSIFSLTQAHAFSGKEIFDGENLSLVLLGPSLVCAATGKEAVRKNLKDIDDRTTLKNTGKNKN